MRSSSVGRSRSISPSKQQLPIDSWGEGWQNESDDWQNSEGKQSHQKKSKALNAFFENSAQSFDRSSAKSVDWEEPSKSAYSTESTNPEHKEKKPNKHSDTSSKDMDELDRLLQRRQGRDSRTSGEHDSAEQSRSKRISRSPSKPSRQVMRAASSSENDRLSQITSGHVLSSFLEESRTKANKKLPSDERSRGAYSTMSRLKRNSGDLSSMVNQKASQMRPINSTKDFQKGGPTCSPRKLKTGLDSFLNVNRSNSKSDLETRSVYTSMTRMRRKMAGIEEKPIPKSKEELMSLFKSLAPKEVGTVEKEGSTHLSKTQQIKMEAKLSLEHASARQILRRSRRNSLIRDGTDTGSNLQSVETSQKYLSPTRRVRRLHEGARSASRSDRMQRSPRKTEKQSARPIVHQRQTSQRVQPSENLDRADKLKAKERKIECQSAEEDGRPVIRQRSIRKLLLSEEQGSKDSHRSSIMAEADSDLSTRRRRSPRKGSRDEWDKSEESSSKTRHLTTRKSFDEEQEVKARRFRQESTIAVDQVDSHRDSRSRSYRRSHTDTRAEELTNLRASSSIHTPVHDTSPKMIQRQRSRKVVAEETHLTEDSIRISSRAIENEAHDATYTSSSQDSPRPMQRQRSTKILMDAGNGQEHGATNTRTRPIENEAHDATYTDSSRESPRPMQRQRSTRIVIDEESSARQSDESYSRSHPIEDEAHDANYASSSRKSPPPIQRQRSTRIVVEEESETYNKDIGLQKLYSDSDVRSQTSPRRSGKPLKQRQREHPNSTLDTRCEDFNSTPRTSNKQRSTAVRRITAQNLPEMVHEEADEDGDEVPYRERDIFTFYSWSNRNQEESVIQKQRRKLKESLRGSPLHSAYRMIEAT